MISFEGSFFDFKDPKHGMHYVKQAHRFGFVISNFNRHIPAMWLSQDYGATHTQTL